MSYMNKAKGKLFSNDNSAIAEYSRSRAVGQLMTHLDMSNYGSNIILVLLKMDSERYGEFYFYRFVKMYNIPDSTSAPAPPGG